MFHSRPVWIRPANTSTGQLYMRFEPSTNVPRWVVSGSLRGNDLLYAVGLESTLHPADVSGWIVRQSAGRFQHYASLSIDVMTSAPTMDPTAVPTGFPTSAAPTTVPTGAPTSPAPTLAPSSMPTVSVPTAVPTVVPTSPAPTGPPATAYPSTSPTTGEPTQVPISIPVAPTPSPTHMPASSRPTQGPTPIPTPIPTIRVPVSTTPESTPNAGAAGRDHCNGITCARICNDECGWSRSQKLCVTGLTTTADELSLGDGCPDDLTSAAPELTWNEINSGSATPEPSNGDQADASSMVVDKDDDGETPVAIIALVTLLVVAILLGAYFAKKQKGQATFAPAHTDASI